MSLHLKVTATPIGRYVCEVGGVYSTTNTYFAWGKLKNGNNVARNISAFLGCRDLLVNVVRSNYLLEDLPELRTELIFSKKYNKKHLKFGSLMDRAEDAIRFLNVIEQRNRWKRSIVVPITTTEGVKSNRTDVSDRWSPSAFRPDSLIYVVGSKCWKNNVYFLYMYLHIIRAFLGDYARRLKGILEWPDFMTAIQNTRDRYNNPDSSWVTYTDDMDKWPIIWNNRRKLFRGLTMKDMYISSGMNDGIFALTCGDAKIKVVKERFSKLMEGIDNGK